MPRLQFPDARLERVEPLGLGNDALGHRRVLRDREVHGPPPYAILLTVNQLTVVALKVFAVVWPCV